MEKEVLLGAHAEVVGVRTGEVETAYRGLRQHRAVFGQRDAQGGEVV